MLESHTRSKRSSVQSLPLLNIRDSSQTMNSTQDDGFTFVTYKKKKKSPYLKAVRRKDSYFKYSLSTKTDSIYQSNFNKEQVMTILKNLEKSDFFEEFKKMFQESISDEKWATPKNDELNYKMNALHISELSASIDIVCYGLGPFLSCMKACTQLAFLLALKNFLNTQNVSLYDPVFSIDEKSYLTKLGFIVLNLNEKARRTVTERTIFFMPHCDLPLYNNLLWSNWNINSISNVVIIGNSLSGYERLINSVLEENGFFVNVANRFISEVKIKNNYECPDVFNDMSIHYFKKESLSKVCSSEIWLKTEKPIYKSPESVVYS